ncbi:MAG: hypothetical protein WCO30_00775 [bacterium]
MIEFTTALFLMLSTMTGMPKEAEAKMIASSTVDDGQKEAIVRVIEAKKMLTFEDYVRAYYADTPILAEIARCESTFRHYLPNGEILRGKVNKGDVGVMQINEYYHKDQAEKLGYDLETIEGNLAYAKNLYDRQGSAPWVSSSPCWKKYENKNLVEKPTVLAKK